MDSFSFSGKNVVLTGGTGEIGRAFLEQLSKKNVARVFVPSSDQQKIDSLAKEFPFVKASVCDLALKEGNDAFLAFLESELNGEYVDLVFFGAGVLGGKEVSDGDWWDDSLNCFGINVLSPDYSFEKMIQMNLLSRQACIIAFGSIAGHLSYSDMTNITTYAASKAALHRSVMCWASNHPDKTIFEVAFGAVNTKMLHNCRPDHISVDNWQKLLMDDIPIKEIPSCKIVATTVFNLLESSGYRLFHGQVVHLSGGEYKT